MAVIKNTRRNKLVIERFIKRVMDVALSSIILLAISPLLVMIALLILLLDGKPIFFRQKRVGQYEQEYTMWKFRSMTNRHHLNKPRYTWSGHVPEDFVFKSASADRVTPVGRILRKYSLDELPQFVHVLFGQMSIVGPRPEVPEITKFYNENQRRRLRVKPGITGFAQVNGRSSISHGEKIQFDNLYVDKQTFGMDVRIILKTVLVVVSGKSSY